jgi:TrkA domain protein
VDVKEVLLPSIGVRYEFTSHDGERIGIIARRSGEFDVVRAFLRWQRRMCSCSR